MPEARVTERGQGMPWEPPARGPREVNCGASGDTRVQPLSAFASVPASGSTCKVTGSDFPWTAPGCLGST